MAGAAFGKRVTTVSAAASGVTRICVSSAAQASKDPARIVGEVVEFVNALLHQGAYLRHELPVNAMRVCHADYYLAQVAKGGHGQFLADCGWEAAIIQDITDGLKAMHAVPYNQIFADLRRLVEGDKRRLKAVCEKRLGDALDAELKALDDRFFAQDPYAVFAPIIAAWVRRLPELEAVEDGDYGQRLQQLVASNPQRQARMAAREREVLTAQLRDPLRVAAQLLCVKGRCLPLQGIGGGDPAAVAPDGREGTGWLLQTGEGRMVAFMFSDLAYLCDTELPDGRKLTNEVMQELQTKLNGANPDREVLTQLAKVTHQEVASLPVRDVTSAIEAAQRLPVVAMATLLCARLGTDEQVRDVFACVQDGAGEWLWTVVTDKRAGLFSAGGDEIVLNDLDMQPLATITAREAREAVALDVIGRS